MHLTKPTSSSADAIPVSLDNYRVVASARDFSPADWNTCNPGGHPLWRWEQFALMESAGIGPSGFEYLTFFDVGRIVAVLPLFWFDRYPLDLPAGPLIRTAIGRVRRSIPSLLTLRVLFCGHPLAEGAVILLRPGYRLTFTSEVLRLVARRAAAHGLNFTIHKDVPAGNLGSLYPDLAAAGHFVVPALPGARVPLAGLDWESYWPALKLKARSNLRRKMRQVAAQPALRIERVARFAPLADEMHALYRQTLNRAKMRLDELTPGYFSGLAHDEHNGACVVACCDGDRLVGFALVLIDGPHACCLRVGLDYSHPLKAAIYFALHLEALRLALAADCPELDLCPTTYQPKREMGAELRRLVYIVSHRRALGRWIGRLALPPMLRHHQLRCDVPRDFIG